MRTPFKHRRRQTAPLDPEVREYLMDLGQPIGRLLMELYQYMEDAEGIPDRKLYRFEDAAKDLAEAFVDIVGLE